MPLAVGHCNLIALAFASSGACEADWLLLIFQFSGFSIAANMGTCSSKIEVDTLLEPYLSFTPPTGEALAAALALVAESWKLISHGSPKFLLAKENGMLDSFVSPMGQFYTVFYEDLFASHPEAKPLFKSSLKVQGKKLVMMLTAIVGLASSGDLGGLKQATTQLAWRHRAIGVELVQFHFVGSVLIRTLSECLGSDFTDELRAAWTSVYCILMSFIIPVFQQTVRTGGKHQVAPAPLPSRLADTGGGVKFDAGAAADGAAQVAVGSADSDEYAPPCSEASFQKRPTSERTAGLAAGLKHADQSIPGEGQAKHDN